MFVCVYSFGLEHLSLICLFVVQAAPFIKEAMEALDEDEGMESEEE